MVAFFGAFAYLANMGTVQHFVVPLEMFAIHYAYLPWIMYTAIQFLEYGKRKALGFFLIITLLMIPQAHTATLFYTFFGGFVLMILSIIVFERKHHMTMRGIVLIVLTLFLNSYWLLPNLFAARTQATEVRNSKINRLFTPEAFAKNQLYGNPFDAALLKNFLFEWQLYDYSAQHMTDVVGPWKDHLKNPLVAGFGYSVFFIAIAGIISVILKKQKHAIILIPLTTVAYLMLLNGTWPITVFFDSLGLISNTLKEALRFPFTKFSILYMLGLSIYFSYGIE
jgi:hypothetical protein